MSISSISLTFFSMTGAAPARVAPTSPAANDATPVAPQSCEAHGAGQGRRNVLYEAMMAALREMGLTGDPAPAPGAPPTAPAATPAAAPAAQLPAPASSTPATTTPAGTTPAADPAAPAPSIEDAVFAFAHALWQALRGSESGRSNEQHHDDHEEHHGQHRHRHGDEMSRGYSGLATRLDALAVRFETGTGAVAGTPAAPGSAASGSADPAAVASPAAVQTSEAAAAPAAATPAPAPTSPLEQAFDALMRVLRAMNPNAPSPNSASPSLPAFLHSLARGLNAEHTTPAFSGVGVVINITA